MREKINERTAMKLNVINIAEHHRKHCDLKNCNVSLTLLRIMAEKAGCEFTKEEMGLFL